MLCDAMQIKEPKFHYGPISIGIFIALIWVGFLTPYLSDDPNIKLKYFVGLFSVGLLLRPFLEVTGLYSLYSAIVLKREQKKFAKREAEISRKIALKERDDRYRKSRLRDRRLPKHW